MRCDVTFLDEGSSAGTGTTPCSVVVDVERVAADKLALVAGQERATRGEDVAMKSKRSENQRGSGQ